MLTNSSKSGLSVRPTRKSAAQTVPLAARILVKAPTGKWKLTADDDGFELQNISAGTRIPEIANASLFE